MKVENLNESSRYERENNPTECWCPCVKDIGYPAGMRPNVAQSIH
ncbi:MAG: hypothetical protein WDZ41_05575 [Candidatus Babeliales bacterium]